MPARALSDTGPPGVESGKPSPRRGGLFSNLTPAPGAPRYRYVTLGLTWGCGDGTRPLVDRAPVSAGYFPPRAPDHEMGPSGPPFRRDRGRQRHGHLTNQHPTSAGARSPMRSSSPHVHGLTGGPADSGVRYSPSPCRGEARFMSRVVNVPTHPAPRAVDRRPSLLSAACDEEGALPSAPEPIESEGRRLRLLRPRRPTRRTLVPPPDRRNRLAPSSRPGPTIPASCSARSTCGTTT